jgi:UPF0755 protein
MRQALPTLDTTRQRLNALPRSPAEALEPGRAPRPPRRIRERREARRMNGFLRFISAILTFCFLGMSVVAISALLLRSTFAAPGPLAHSTVTVIPRGEGVYEIASRLEREGVVSDRRLFVAQYLAHSMKASISGGRTIQLQAGEFEFKKQASIEDVLEILSQGKAVLYRVSIPEGLTSQQIVARLMAEENLDGEITEVPPEGALLPDTYRFSRGTARADIIERMRSDQRRFIAAIWDKRQPDLPYKSIEQALVMASIVEKETGRADEPDHAFRHRHADTVQHLHDQWPAPDADREPRPRSHRGDAQSSEDQRSIFRRRWHGRTQLLGNAEGTQRRRAGLAPGRAGSAGTSAGRRDQRCAGHPDRQ